MTQFQKPVRETLSKIINEYKYSHLPVTLFPGDEWTVPDGDLEGTLFDTLAVLDDKVVLTAHEGSYCVPLDQAPVPAGALSRIARILISKEWEDLGKALLNHNCDSDLIDIYTKRLTYLVKDSRLWLDADRAAERQVFECLLALGGPHDSDDELDDGCGDLFLGSNPDTLPTVLTGKNNEQFLADEISWVATATCIELVMRNSASGKEALFVVLPDTSRGIVNAPESPEAQSLHGVDKLERILYAMLDEQQKDERKAFEKESLENPPAGELYVLAIREILRTKADDHTSLSFERNSYDLQADIPHITAWWGGPTAVDTVYIHAVQDSIGIATFPIAGRSHDKQYYGNEPGVAWDRLFSEIYSHLQGPEDPEWEEWLEENRKRIVSDELTHTLIYNKPDFPEEGVEAPCLLPQPFTPYATLMNAYVAGVDIEDQDHPYGTPVFGVDLGGQLLTITPDDIDFNELYGLYLIIKDLPIDDELPIL